MLFLSLAVIAFAKKTGDYAVLSRPDLSVLALAYALEVERHGTWRIRDEVGGKTGQQKHEAKRLAEQQLSQPQEEQHPQASTSVSADGEVEKEAKSEPQQAAAAEEPVDETPSELANGEDEEETQDAADAAEIEAAIAKLDLQAAQNHDEENERDIAEEGGESDDEGWTHVASSSKRQAREQEDYGGSDGEGEWVTAENITRQKQRDLGLVTDEAMEAMRGDTAVKEGGAEAQEGDAAPAASTSTSKPSSAPRNRKKKGPARLTVATMTADYAVQNVLIQMGLSLVSTEGLRIQKVRSWVLRCHACFKLCKDSEKKFCPHCGNATLLRTSVTSAAPGAAAGGAAGAGGEQGLQIHLKKNFQYRNRGTIYSLPAPKPSSSSALKDPKRRVVPILREDQPEWQRSVERERVRKNKEQKALDRALDKGHDTLTARYTDPDFIPGLLGGDSQKEWQGLPAVGAGRRNPNQARHGRRRK